MKTFLLLVGILSVTFLPVCATEDAHKKCPILEDVIAGKDPITRITSEDSKLEIQSKLNARNNFIAYCYGHEAQEVRTQFIPIPIVQPLFLNY